MSACNLFVKGGIVPQLSAAPLFTCVTVVLAWARVGGASYHSNMFSINGRDEIVEAFDALTAALDRAMELDFDVLTSGETLAKTPS